MTKPNLSRREAHWLDFLGQFGVSQLTFIKGRIHVLRYTPFRVPQRDRRGADFNNLYTVSTAVDLPEDSKTSYDVSIVLRNSYRSLNGADIAKRIKKERVSGIFKLFSVKDGLLNYE